MPRLEAIDPGSATGSAKLLLDGVQSRLGVVPNLHRTLANAPAALEGYLAFGDALGRGLLSARLRERIALTVAESNGCDYCLSAHCAVGRMVGLSEQELVDSRKGQSPDSRTDAVLRFARRIVTERGLISDDDVARIRRAGFGDGEIAEIVANVAINMFTNYFNHVAGTVVDFPRVPSVTAA